MTGADRTTLACALAALLAGFPLTALTTDRSYLVLALVLIGASAGVGFIARRLGAPDWVARLLQLTGLLLLPMMVPATQNPERLIDRTVTHIQASAAPMPYELGFAAMSGALLWVLFVVLDALGDRLRNSVVGAALVLPGFVSVALIAPDLVTFAHFVVPAVGFAALLATSTRNQAGLDSPGASALGLRRGILGIAALTTAVALAASLFLGARLPAADQTWDLGANGGVQLVDPSLDLIRNINSTSDRPVLSYRSDDGQGTYLRLAALSGFTENGFGLVPTELFPAPLPVQQPRGQQRWVRVNITVGDFTSQWLPLPWVPNGFTAAGDWRYDRSTLSVAAVGDTQTDGTRKLRYRATGWQPIDVDDALAGAAVGDPRDRGLTLALPDGISDDVRATVAQVTSGSASAGDKALALRDYLRNGAFRYSTQIVPGTTIGTLNDFLTGSRVGYCEQFAGGLATMARIAGIPSRVVVGFLPGRKSGNVWNVGVRNMHAWTELHFEELGWVALDATPPGAVEGGPPATSRPEPTISPSSAAPQTEAPVPRPTTAERPTPSADTAPPLWPILGWLAGALVLIALPLLTRAGLRALRLSRRAPGPAAEGAWAETKALLADARIRVGDGSPRQQAVEVAGRLDASAAGAVRELAVAVERARYARAPIAPDGLAPLVKELATALAGARNTHLLDRWWPRSLRPRRWRG